jgi:hypothetical protein
VTLVGATTLYAQSTNENIHGNFVVNFVVNFGGIVERNNKNPQQTTDAGGVSVSLCGTSLSGQAAHM